MIEGKKVTLVQPLHSYAKEEGKGQVYMPNSLWIAGARLLGAGANIDFQDANLHPVTATEELVGVSLLGSPYVPVVRNSLLKKKEKRLIVGGQVVEGFVQRNIAGQIEDKSQFERLFGKNAIVGNNDAEVTRAIGVRVEDLPQVAQVSLVPVYERINDEDMEQYLSHEFSFFLSQGCRFACKFCAAVRTIKDPVTGNVLKVKEDYRNISVVEKDLTYLVERAQTFGLTHIDFYLSNLDVFQTPHKLKEFAEMVQKIKKEHPGFSINMRALATVDSFLRAHKKNPEAVRKIIDAGFHTVGFGIDGSTPAVWQSIRKGHNTEEKCIDAIRIAREEYNLTPELLMVFGHLEEDEESLKAAVTFTLDMVERYGAVPRPHVAKDIIPGNEHWKEPQNAERVKFLINHPQYFQALDYTALPSSISHPDPKLRALVEKYYTQICNIPGNATGLVYPIAPELSSGERARRRKMNIGRWDR